MNAPVISPAVEVKKSLRDFGLYWIPERTIFRAKPLATTHSGADFFRRFAAPNPAKHFKVEATNYR
jgi:hypothetical protein